MVKESALCMVEECPLRGEGECPPRGGECPRCDVGECPPREGECPPRSGGVSTTWCMRVSFVW